MVKPVLVAQSKDSYTKESVPDMKMKWEMAPGMEQAHPGQHFIPQLSSGFCH